MSDSDMNGVGGDHKFLGMPIGGRGWGGGVEAGCSQYKMYNESCTCR